MAVLLAGIGLGVGVAALIEGQQSTPRHVTPLARTQPAQSPGKPLGPATAGVQPGREEVDGPTGATEKSKSKTTVVGDAVPVLDADATASFARLRKGLPGRVDIAVEPIGAGAAQRLGENDDAHGWSTTKVPVLSALLAARGGLRLDAEEESWARSAITESNNESILRLFAVLKRLKGGLIGASESMQELLAKSGDEETVVATAPPPSGAVTTFGQTEWRPSNAVKFFSALARGCLLTYQATQYVLGLMRHVESSESWGLGSAGFPSVAFKGGWGPEPSGAYLVRQSGIVDVGSSRAVAVTMVAFPPAGTGSFEAGISMLTRTAIWLREHLQLVSRAKLACH